MPCPIRFGPPPRMMILRRVRRPRLVVARLVGRVEVRRVRLELGAAGVDGLVDRPRCPRASRRARTAASRRAEQRREPRVREALPAWPRAAARRRARRASRRRARARSAMISSMWRRNHGSIARQRRDLARRVSPRRNASPTCHSRSAFGTAQPPLAARRRSPAAARLEARGCRSRASASPSAATP